MVVQINTNRDFVTVSLVLQQTETLAAITVAGVAALCVHTRAIAQAKLTLVHICKTQDKQHVQEVMTWHFTIYQKHRKLLFSVRLQMVTWSASISLTITGLGREVVFEAWRTLALEHARSVDTPSWSSTDAGKQLTLVDIWGKKQQEKQSPGTTDSEL